VQRKHLFTPHLPLRGILSLRERNSQKLHTQQISLVCRFQIPNTFKYSQYFRKVSSFELVNLDSTAWPGEAMAEIKEAARRQPLVFW